jgi:hypothetical protein
MLRPLLASLVLLLLAPAAAQAQSTIQPGAMLQTDGGQCTLNFIFDGTGVNAGRVFVGTAAHCAGKVGDEARDIDDHPFGTFAFIGDAGDPATDYAFIEVVGDELRRVDPAMKGHPEFPKGVTTPEETEAGDAIQMSGYGVGFGETQPTQEGRQTYLQSDDADIFTLSGPSVNGDSGGPFVHVDSGKALGLVSQYGFSYAATDVGPTIQGVLAKAAAKGFPVALRAAGQPAPVVPARSAEAPPHPAPAATQSSAPAAKPATKKSARQRACERKAKKIKSKRKRKAALKRCAKRR